MIPKGEAHTSTTTARSLDDEEDDDYEEEDDDVIGSEGKDAINLNEVMAKKLCRSSHI